MDKNYLLKDGDRCYATGCYLIYHKKDNWFSFDGWEDGNFFDGGIINIGSKDTPHIHIFIKKGR